MKHEINPGTVLVPCPAVLVSVGYHKEHNIITISWAANVCSNPPRVAISVRPNRHSFALLKRIGDFVINIPTTKQLGAVVFCGTKSGKDLDKFQATGLTPQPSTAIHSPMIAECLLNIECKVWKVIELGSHHLIIADVVAVHVDDAILHENGQVDLGKMGLFTYNPLVGQYWRLGTQLHQPT